MSASPREQLERAERYLASIPGAAERAMAAALNDAAAAGRSEAARVIAERYVVRPSDAFETMRVERARPAALEAAVIARSPSLTLTYFPHAPAASGTGGPGKPVLRAEVRRGGEKPVAGAFMATLGGKPRIVVRTGEKSARGRDALRTLFTVPLGEMLGVEAVREPAEVRALEVLDERLTAGIDRELKGAA